MPQLDQFTYLTQFVWLCLCFMGYYVLLYNNALPKIGRILKLRSRLVSQQNKVDAPNGQLVQQDDVVTHSLNSSAAYLNSSVSGASQWCNEMVTSLNANQLEPVNKVYVRSLAEMCISQIVKFSVLDTLSALSSLRISQQGFEKLNAIYVLRTQKLCLQRGSLAASHSVRTVKTGSRKKKQQNA